MSSNSSSPVQATTSGTSLSPSQPSSDPTQVPTTNDPSTSPPATSPTPTSPSPSSTPATSSSPATQPTTAASSPEQSTSPAAQTTSASQAASASASASASSVAATSTLASTTSFYTSQVATTFSSTDAGGSIVYVTSTVPEVFSTSVSAGSTSGGSTSHTGVIVGAVVGGVAGLVILVLLIFCIRRRAYKDDFDGNFDPDRVVGHVEGGAGGTLPNVDLADEVTPFPRPYADQGSMRQYGNSSYHALPSTVTSGQSGSDFYPPGASSPTFDTQPRQHMKAGFGQPPSGAYAPAADMHGGGPGEWTTRSESSPPPSTVSYNTSSARGAKEREATSRGGQGSGLVLATQPEAAEGSGDVVVHQDAGRAPIQEHHTPPPTEIPPAYESIRD